MIAKKIWRCKRWRLEMPELLRLIYPKEEISLRQCHTSRKTVTHRSDDEDTIKS